MAVSCGPTPLRESRMITALTSSSWQVSVASIASTKWGLTSEEHKISRVLYICVGRTYCRLIRPSTACLSRCPTCQSVQRKLRQEHVSMITTPLDPKVGFCAKRRRYGVIGNPFPLRARPRKDIVCKGALVRHVAWKKDFEPHDKVEDLHQTPNGCHLDRQSLSLANSKHKGQSGNDIDRELKAVSITIGLLSREFWSDLRKHVGR